MAERVGLLQATKNELRQEIAFNQAYARALEQKVDDANILETIFLENGLTSYGAGFIISRLKLPTSYANVFGLALALVTEVRRHEDMMTQTHIDALRGGARILEELYGVASSGGYFAVKANVVFNTTDGYEYVRGNLNSNNPGWYELVGVRTNDGWIY